MKKLKEPRYLFCWAGVLLLCMVVFYSTDIRGKSQIPEEASPQQRADIIIIDISNTFGELEKASVEFLHEAHTEALAKKNLDCKTCHLAKDDVIIPKFKRLTDENRVDVMNIYHDGCISCHGEMKVAGEKAGPVECDDCHRKTKKYSSSRQPMGFDTSLHARHVTAHEKKCEQCHHKYDEKEKKLIYVKGEEESCRDCHKQEAKEKQPSLRMSTHVKCINCHLQKLEKNKGKEPINFPVNCSGCHDLEAQKKIKKLEIIPRLERNQPDMVLIKTGNEALDVVGKNRMNLVPFNHKTHEGYNNTCRVCHHESMKKCNECHTLNGSDKGKGVRLEQAMHKKDTDRSCIGCHATHYRKQNCAGCHDFISHNRAKSETSCAVCHVPLPEGMEINEKTAQLLFEKQADKKFKTVKEEDIPEKIVIDKLIKKYEAVEFPHRKIVNTIVKNMADNKLAEAFHRGNEAVCKGCHHNIPPSKKPTACYSCHTKPFDGRDLHKPGIVGAYHIQCMGCHTSMKIEKLGCVDCHKEKVKQ